MPQKKTTTKSSKKCTAQKSKRKPRKTRILKRDIEDINRARRIVSVILSRLEDGLTSAEFISSEQDQFLWGDKDNAITILSKLTKMLLDLIPASQQFDDEDKNTSQEDITVEDIEILQRLMGRYVGGEKVK